MMYAGDAYLNNEVRKLLETNEHFMCATAEPGVCSAGQLPHHFIPACGKGVKGCKCEQWGPRKVRRGRPVFGGCCVVSLLA